VTMWSGEVSRRLRDKRGGDWCADLRPGLALFIAARGAAAQHGNTSVWVFEVRDIRVRFRDILVRDLGFTLTVSGIYSTTSLFSPQKIVCGLPHPCFVVSLYTYLLEMLLS
jgi:hypothetical protein